MLTQSLLPPDIKKLIELCPQAIQQLRVAAETMKCDLAGAPVSAMSITMPRLGQYAEGMVFEARLNRIDLETIISPLIHRTMAMVAKVIEQTGINHHKITSVILVGGSSRLELARRLLRARFPSADMRTDFNPDTIVAQGAALLASQLMFKHGDLVHDVAPLGLGVGVQNDVMCVSNNTGYEAMLRPCK